MAEFDEESLAEAFWGIARQLRHSSREALAPLDISPSHGRALVTLGRRGEMRLRELSERLHIAPRSTTEVIDALEERGFVERRPDPDDRRATLVAVTDAGKRALKSIRAARTAETETFFGRLSDTDRAHLHRILRKLG